MSDNLKQQIAELHNLLAGTIDIMKRRFQEERVDVKEMLENITRIVDVLGKLERFASAGTVTDCSRDMEVIQHYVSRMCKATRKRGV